jgi:hypothetical protein
MTIRRNAPLDGAVRLRYDKAMRKLNQNGSAALLVSFIVTALLLVCALSFAFWAYTERQDYKTRSDAKVQAAVARADEALTAKLENDFLAREKEPYKSYQSPASFGAVRVMYPKTWSAYVIETNGGTPVNAYFHPNYVPGINLNETAYAVHLEVIERSYDQELKSFDAQVKAGKVRATPYRAPKMPNNSGMRFDGDILNKKKGTVVIFPLRDKVIRLTSEALDYVPDFEKAVLENLVFVP